MKKIYFISIALLFSCSDNNGETLDEKIISIDNFTIILEEIHLAEANFQLTKISNKNRAENNLTNEYNIIFIEYNTNREDFEESLLYYSERPEILENIYIEVLENLKEKQSELD